MSPARCLGHALQKGGAALPALVCSLLFVAGMALLGNSRLSGYLYVAALPIGLYVMLRLPLRETVVPSAVSAYVGSCVAFLLLVVAHVLLVPASPSAIEQAARVIVGPVHGLFFLALFGFSRRKLFDFIVLVAACHAAVAIAVALSQAVDLDTLSLIRRRAGGTTNPIPFSAMLLTSVGLSAIFVAGRIDRRRPWFGFGLLALVLAGGLLGVFLGGTRGVLISVPLLAALLFVALSDRLGKAWSAAFTVLLAAGSLLVADDLFARERGTWNMLLAFLGGADASSFPPTAVGLRFQLWVYALDLIREAPLLGHGLGTFPELLKDPQLGVPAQSLLFHFNHVHNQFLGQTLETGLLGAALFLAPMAIALVAGMRMALDRAERLKGLALIWIAGAYMIFGLTAAFSAHASWTLQYGVYLGMAIWLVPGGRSRAADQPPETVS